MAQRITIMVALILLAISSQGQSPHGDDFNVNCAICHTTDEWDLIENSEFNHDTTGFQLKGQHELTDCRQCHTSLKFKQAGSNCISCHTDVHQNTTGQDCDYCHNTNSWIVDNISEIHTLSRFPLTGAHNVTDCYACHPSATLLNFKVLGIDCYSCHNNDYQATTNPNHAEAGYSTTCESCHSLHATTWDAKGFEHGFFPLIQGHSGIDCATCHGSGVSQSVSADCYDCHNEDYESATNPDHLSMEISQQCTECHTLSEGWSPAEYRLHDSNYFPIYSGAHNGEWNSCATCHNVADNYSVFTCTDCHTHRKNAMDRKHNEVRDYRWDSNECYECHPTGREGD